MNIEVFNETNSNIVEELNELKILLQNICQDEKIGDGEFNVIIVDSKKIRTLNKEYRNIDRVTDVISFALEDDDTFHLENYRVLGDIYICLEQALKQAEDYGHSFKRELSFLAVHGLLHLLGYDHMSEEEEKIMFKKQEEVLSRYGIER